MLLNPWSRSQRRRLIERCIWVLFWINAGVLFYPVLQWALLSLGDWLGV